MIIAADILDFLFVFIPVASLTHLAFRVGLSYGRSKGGPSLFAGASILTFSYLFKLYFDIIFGKVDGFWLFVLTFGTAIGLAFALVGTIRIYSFLAANRPDVRTSTKKVAKIAAFVIAIFLIIFVPYFLGIGRPLYWELGAVCYVLTRALLFSIVLLAAEFFCLLEKKLGTWKTRLLRFLAAYYLIEPSVWLIASHFGFGFGFYPNLRLGLGIFGLAVSLDVGLLVIQFIRLYLPIVLRQVKTTYVDALRVKVLRDLYLIGAGLTVFIFVILIIAQSLYENLRVSTLESYAQSRVAIERLAAARVRSSLQEVVLDLQRAQSASDPRIELLDLQRQKKFVDAAGLADSAEAISLIYGDRSTSDDTLVSELLLKSKRSGGNQGIRITMGPPSDSLKYLLVVGTRDRNGNRAYAFALVDLNNLMARSFSGLNGFGIQPRLVSQELTIIYSGNKNEIGESFKYAVLKNAEISSKELTAELGALSKTGRFGYRILKGQSKAGMGEYYLLITTPLNFEGYRGSFASIQPEDKISNLFRPANSLLFLAGLLVVGLVGGGIVIMSVAFKWSMRLEKEVQDKVFELRSSEDKYRRIVENPYIGSFIMVDKRLIFANSRLAEILETEIDRLAGSDLSVFIDEKDYESLREVFETILSGEKNGGRWLVNGTTASGRRITMSGYSSLIHIGNKVGVQSLVVDSTSEFREKEKLEQFERLESMATLAAGIAHDFNNILQVVLGSSQLLQRRLEDTEFRKYADNITNVALRGSDLSRRLLTFSRQKGLEQRRPFDINAIIVESLPLFEETFPRTIKIETELLSTPIYVEGDQSQIQQVIFNLAVNARDAMPHGGTLLIKTEIREVSPMEADIYQVRPGEYAYIMVRDNGEGIPPDLMSKVFEPFFTTKPPGKGTGLGLSVVYGIVRSHNGFLKVYSEVKKGTVFSIFLPPSSSDALTDAGEVKPRVSEHFSTYGSRILFVDDESGIREAAEFLLEQAGYSVVTAKDGMTALEIYRREWEEIDLVVLDLNMPELSGREVLENFTIINPSVRVLIATGYITPEERAGLKGIVEVIEKPFDFEQLIQKVRIALEASDRTNAE